MKRKRHAQIHLPTLGADDALLVVRLLDRASSAIWRAHGAQMALRLQPPDAPQPLVAGNIGDHDLSEPPKPDCDEFPS